MKKTRFSVIMPLYNKASFVRKALESIASQTYRDFDLIIINDGSTDNSAAICEDYINNLQFETINLKRENIRIISQPNSGVAKARNVGVENSHGQFVCFLDADDWWEPNFLEEIDKLIMEYPDAGIYASNYIYYKPGKTHVALKLERGYMNYPKAYLDGPMPIWTGATCMPRLVFDEMGGFPVGVKLGEDFLLWAKTALHYKVAFCEKALAFYNNDVPASLRATRNLHKPEYHMLFNMQDIESIVDSRLSIDDRGEWKALLDKLRVSGLMDYWLDERYHDAAKVELAKVDWSRQPKSIRAQYKKPILWLRAKRGILRAGSYCKQRLYKLLNLS